MSFCGPRLHAIDFPWRGRRALRPERLGRRGWDVPNGARSWKGGRPRAPFPLETTLVALAPEPPRRGSSAHRGGPVNEKAAQGGAVVEVAPCWDRNGANVAKRGRFRKLGSGAARTSTVESARCSHPGRPRSLFRCRG